MVVGSIAPIARELGGRALRLLALACLVSAAWPPAAAVAANQQSSNASNAATRRYSPLELERIRRALARARGKLEPRPQGKRIESIEIVALPVFEPEDAVPQFLNWFHVTTQRYVIEREVLLHVGEPYDQSRSDETERNLRLLFLFSVVVALPLQGSGPDTVRYLVITKDLWSLRLGWNGRVNKGVVDFLSLQPTERNLFGTGRQLFGTLLFSRRTYTLGAGYVEPRLAGSRTRIIASAEAIFNCKSGEVEGSSGSFEYSRPLYSRRTAWSYATSVAWTNSRPPLRTVGDPSGSICSSRSAEDLPVSLSEDDERVALYPNQYLYDNQAFTQSFTRSYGYNYKTNLSFGLEARRIAYGTTRLSSIRLRSPDGTEELTEEERFAVERFYERRIPASDTRLSPFFQVQSFTNDFHRDINSETLGLQEDLDFRLGHISSLRVYPALEALGSTRNLLGITATASYATSVHTGYAKASITHDVELSSIDQTDALLSMALRFTSPRLGAGRFVYDARLVRHYLNYRNTNQWLGGTNRLRGFQNTAELGDHLVVANLEFRSRPIEILSAQLGAVVFYDMGDAFDSFAELRLRHGIGAGLRFLAPQLDRDVFRLDVGVPVPLDAARGELTVIATFGQAFGVP